MKWNHIIKGTSTPVIIRASGVDLFSMADIEVKIGDETYSKISNPLNIVTFEDDITKLYIKIGNETSLENGYYTLTVSVVNANFPEGSVIADCKLFNLEVVVRDGC